MGSAVPYLAAGLINPGLVPGVYAAKKMKAPPAPSLTPPPPIVDEKAADLVKGLRAKRSRMGGGSPSALTGPLGLTAPPQTAQKTLLGL